MRAVLLKKSLSYNFEIHILNDENSLLLRNQNNFAKHLQQGVTLGFPPITKVTESVINNNLIIFSDLT